MSQKITMTTEDIKRMYNIAVAEQYYRRRYWAFESIFAVLIGILSLVVLKGYTIAAIVATACAFTTIISASKLIFLITRTKSCFQPEHIAVYKGTVKSIDLYFDYKLVTAGEGESFALFIPFPNLPLRLDDEVIIVKHPLLRGRAAHIYSNFMLSDEGYNLMLRDHTYSMDD